MEERTGIVVTKAYLKDSCDMPAGGGIETSLYTTKGVKMLYTDIGLICNYKDKLFIVPLANIKCVQE